MGLDARVSCRCWQDGLVSPPPVPVVMDEDGRVTAVDDTDASWMAVTHWRSTACPHRDFNLIWRHIGNWWSVSELEAILHDQGGPATFPVLLTRLPTRNGGGISASESRIGLAELDHLQYRFRPATRLALVSSEQIVVQEQPASPGAWYFAHGRGARYRLSGTGLEILDGSGCLRFAASRVRQDPTDSGYLLTDLDSGLTITVPRRIDKPSVTTPIPSMTFEVHQRQRVYQDIATVVDNLRAVFRLSLESGNPVLWC